MRIAVVDTYYPGFLATLPAPTSYAQGLEYALSRRFGTFDAYSRNLRMQGHECIDIIANYETLQNCWRKENPSSIFGFGLATAFDQISRFKPDVLLVQDLSFFPMDYLSCFKENGAILAGQCSCRFDDDEKLKLFDVLFSSFPFHVDRFNALGVRGVFLPLAFDPIILERAKVASARTHVSFVGGYGRHWETDELFTVLAERTPIQFWGYGFEKAPKVVRDRWQGEAWGLDMYEIYLRSHIVVNRHGWVSQGLSNNLRMFEATGCGAMLLTEASPNTHDYFDASECSFYESPEHAAEYINYYLNRPAEMLRVASAGQRRTLHDHTYFQRMPIVSKVLTECLERKAVSA